MASCVFEFWSSQATDSFPFNFEHPSCANVPMQTLPPCEISWVDYAVNNSNWFYCFQMPQAASAEPCWSRAILDTAKDLVSLEKRSPRTLWLAACWNPWVEIHRLETQLALRPQIMRAICTRHASQLLHFSGMKQLSSYGLLSSCRCHLSSWTPLSQSTTIELFSMVGAKRFSGLAWCLTFGCRRHYA